MAFSPWKGLLGHHYTHLIFKFMYWFWIFIYLTWTIFLHLCYHRYFYALSNGEPLPVKDRLERPVATQKNDTGLTPGLLKILHKQVKIFAECSFRSNLTFHAVFLWFIYDVHVFLKLSEKETVEISDLQRKWKNLCLPMEQLRNLLRLGNFAEGVEWMKFFALACSALGGVCRPVKHNVYLFAVFRILKDQDSYIYILSLDFETCLGSQFFNF